MGNPYAITFGLVPDQYIPRIEQREKVISDFNNSSAMIKAYVIVGVRGSGKTVMLTEISNKIGDDWVVIDLSTQEDMLKSLTSQLYANKRFHSSFVKAKFDFSFLGQTLHIEQAVPAYDYQTAISLMLDEIKKQNQKVLITVDEVSNTDNLRKLASLFQILIRKELPIYLLMAGTPENVYGLMDEKTSTFLYRTPRINMMPLNFGMMKNGYIRNLRIDPSTADRLAQLTKGYPFAYQALGYICWGRSIDPESDSFNDILAEYDYYLQEFSYEKIWEEMSATDQLFAKAISASDEPVVSSEFIKEKFESDIKKYSVYRDRLLKKGIISAPAYGKVTFSLPRFDVFVRQKVLSEQL